MTDATARQQFAAMLERLADKRQLPIVLHCTAGKDRTGWASAVLLTILGVPRETVFEDYLATNIYTAAQNESRIKSVGALLYDPELLRPLIEARREYLQASLMRLTTSTGRSTSTSAKASGSTRSRKQRSGPTS